MTTTEETSEIERFLAWRARLLKEHENEPDWQKEIWAFFLDLYRQTYPVRTFPFVMELWSRYLDWHYNEVKSEPMKSCTKAELQLPAETLLAWILKRFPELPSDTRIESIWASSIGGSLPTVKIVVEHTHVNTDAEKEPKSDG